MECIAGRFNCSMSTAGVVDSFVMLVPLDLLVKVNEVFVSSEEVKEPLLNEVLLEKPANAVFVSKLGLKPEKPVKPLNVLPAPVA